ncbi:MAG: FAD-binding oxidoreductase [Rhizobiaceae bacterium]
MAPIYQSFGRVVPPTGQAIAAAEAIARLQAGEAGDRSLAAFGNGRSYGDSCHNQTGTLVDMRTMNRILDFDPATGVLKAEAGVLLSEIIDRVVPHGWFPAVVPGTRFVTLGGAIANDIHGKNHHRRGSFGNHVTGFSLLRSDRAIVNCSKQANGDLFAATIGGLGLTGLILTATIQLMKVAADVVEKIERFDRIEDYFDRAEEADANNEYAVAWIDQLAGGRGLLLTANHVEEQAATKRPGRRLGVPFQPPLNLLSKPFLRLFNMAYFHGKGRSAEPRRSGYQSFFFPLDGVGNWNRLYGPKGLLQHQSVIPFDTARDAVPELLAAATRSGHGSFLTVLKRFGAIASPGLISFPRPGYTLTLDFPNAGEPTLALMNTLDRITLAAGGGVNAYKDARMPPETFAASYPRWAELEALRDPAFMTDFWRRTAMRLRPGIPNLQAAE